MGCAPGSPCGQKSLGHPNGPGVIIPESQRYWITNNPRPPVDLMVPQVPLAPSDPPPPKQD